MPLNREGSRMRLRNLAAWASGPLLGLAVHSTAAAVPDTGAAPRDSAVLASADSTLNTKKFYEYVSYPVLQLITLPVEVVIVPVVKMALYPSKPPLRYLLNENVIDRTIKLISFTEDIMLYPTMNLAPGTGSSTGLTLRNQSLFGRRSERGVAQGVLYVNGDWKFRSYLSASDILGSGLSNKLSLSMNRVKNSAFNMPGTPVFWNYADTSTTISNTLSRVLFEKFAIRGQYVYRNSHFGASPTENDSSRADFLRNDTGGLDPKMRGLEDSWNDHIMAFGISRDTRNNQNIVLAGSDFGASWQYHFTDAKHNFHNWQGALTNYFKLGKEKYEISSDEERKAGALSMQKVLKKMELETIKREIFNRKVLVTHLYAAQSFEVPGNHMPVYALQTLGNDTPMRGYSGSRFRNYTVLSAGAEYRFPLMRLVDGVIFDEYGVSGRSWDKIHYLEDLKNSWGFGIRVRRPDIYLFRLQLGFHGLHGIQLNMSVDEPY
jgi:hypothetical protein